MNTIHNEHHTSDFQVLSEQEFETMLLDYSYVATDAIHAIDSLLEKRRVDIQDAKELTAGLTLLQLMRSVTSILNTLGPEKIPRTVEGYRVYTLYTVLQKRNRLNSLIIHRSDDPLWFDSFLCDSIHAITSAIDQQFVPESIASLINTRTFFSEIQTIAARQQSMK